MLSSVQQRTRWQSESQGYQFNCLIRTPGKLKREFIGYNRSIAYSPDGTMLATARFDDILGLWDTQTGTERMPPIDTSGYPHSGYIQS